jgi:hypothetical protein
MNKTKDFRLVKSKGELLKEIKDLKTFYFKWYDLLDEMWVEENLPEEYHSILYNPKKLVKYKIEEDVRFNDYSREFEIGFAIYKWHKVEKFDDWEYADQPESQDIHSENSLIGWQEISFEFKCYSETWTEQIKLFVEYYYGFHKSKYFGNRLDYTCQDKQKKEIIKITDQIVNKLISPPKPTLSKRKRGYKDFAWSVVVKERDKKCIHCGSDQDLHAHHIKQYKDHPELRYDVNNGITMCQTCHINYHKENGR